jgi:proteasome lid subunit RPN8/RPN11
MALNLLAAVDDAIRRHGAETYPHECCGALIGRDGVVTQTFPLPNTTEEGPRRRFLVRPSDYQQAERQAAALGADLLGFYHSHPDHPAIPSAFDREHAWPWYAYVIVPVHDARPGVPRAWRLAEDRSHFHELEIVQRAVDPTAAKEAS